MPDVYHYNNQKYRVNTDMYNETVMEHFSNPKNAGEIKDADGVGEVESPECGDTTKIYLKIENDRITDIKFQTLGCAAAIASTTRRPSGKKDSLFITGRRCTSRGNKPVQKKTGSQTLVISLFYNPFSSGSVRTL